MNNIDLGQVAIGEDSVLVVIDVQDRLLPVIRGNKALLQNVLRLIKFSKIVDIPIVITEQESLAQRFRRSWPRRWVLTPSEKYILTVLCPPNLEILSNNSKEKP